MHFSFSILIPFIIYFIYLLRFYNNFQAQKLESSLVAREINGHKYFLFRNICYLGKERQFIFIWGNTSYISGIKTKNELKEINISPIRNHNKFTLKISFISNLTLIKDDSFEIIEIPTILLWRFKPDNLLHLIHDDLIPLFATLKDICDFNIEECSLKRNLAFLDGASPTLYDEWFSLFSKDVPINLTDKNICFREVNVGLRDTLWYQYGFDQPQGPIKQSNISSSLISDFVNFIKNKLDLKKELNKLTSLVINRKFTRRILNEDDLLSYIEEVFIGKTQIKILSENIFNGSSFKMVQEAISSELLIGMHGAAMAMALFLPKNAIVIELFPYGINPQYVSAIHALGQIPGIHFHYFSWINTNRSATLTHPEFPPLFGGIEHLPQREQKWIQEQEHVPAVKCCHDPNYLFHMFQDTFIDKSLKTILQNALNTIQNNSILVREDDESDTFNKWYFPGPVMNISCSFENKHLTIKWIPPINSLEKTFYKIFIMDKNNQWSFKSEYPFLKVKISSFSSSFQIWIMSNSQATDSLDEYKECFL